MEETKVDFFNPHGVEDSDNEENQILEARVDPLEWKQEIDRVYGDLDNIHKEIVVLKKQGDTGYEFEEGRRHIELIIEMCADIR